MKNAAWVVSWYTPSGQRRRELFGSTPKDKQLAEARMAVINSELLQERYFDRKEIKWDDFRKRYTEQVIEGKALASQPIMIDALDSFERLMKPNLVSAISTETIDTFISRRRKEQNRKYVKKDGSVTLAKRVSPATVNKELRVIKAALRKASRWGYLPKVPDFDFEREPQKLVTFMPEAHFVKIYDACNKATMPDSLPVDAGTWWRSFLVMGYLTGWRVSELLAVKWEDINLETGTAITRHCDNKGKRDEMVPLLPMVVDHLVMMGPKPSGHVFVWDHDRRMLDKVFQRIQAAAQVKPEHTKDHYTFHDLRRGFATVNHGRVTGDVLQKLMRHQSYETTRKYLNLGADLAAATPKLFVPSLKIAN